MARKRVNYLQMIHWLKYDEEFKLYCSKHKNISLKRNAYNFYRFFDLKTPTLIRKFLESVEKGSSIDTSQIGDVVYGEPKGRPF